MRPRFLRPRATGALLLLCTSLAAQDRVVLEPAMTHTALARDWTLDGTGTWAAREGLLALVGAGTPRGTIRRPSALAIVSGPDLSDTTLEVDVRSTAALPDVTPRRDVVLVVGYQSPTRFYYVHVSSVRDAVHNGIFLVDQADRRRIDHESTTAPLVDQAWHRVRVRRTPVDGRLEVYVDDRPTPIMAATDGTLTHGRAGVGSFDDTAEFRRLRVAGTRH